MFKIWLPFQLCLAFSLIWLSLQKSHLPSRGWALSRLSRTTMSIQFQKPLLWVSCSESLVPISHLKGFLLSRCLGFIPRESTSDLGPHFMLWTSCWSMLMLWVLGMTLWVYLGYLLMEHFSQCENYCNRWDSQYSVLEYTYSSPCAISKWAPFPILTSESWNVMKVF